MVALPTIVSSGQPADTFDAILAAARNLPFAEQARLIMALLPAVLPAVEAARQGESTPIPGGTVESLGELIARWEAAPDDDDPVWDEIWHNLGIEAHEEAR
jgi:hypothetical protein